ncbi:hypothetical protein SLEP1_g53477 [Rubroshorea leprosula]|uniref:Uncharacterized protein n=1 Tax=Rubroshorea leprosula TaxID=152421 RepID=A0AAV5M9G7_9ROSI|nr:hypothetical protein SLEP1_g53477 [Rubroshorea leprosula]
MEFNVTTHTGDLNRKVKGLCPESRVFDFAWEYGCLFIGCTTKAGVNVEK